ncbi:MAG: Gfo/Idh/MocA family oxidoreductase [Elusimicrobia bacterium]|nr:Gfo/Idh/MocA family oxidoreductase [Elusimicrobiota bacterium]
MLKVGIIGAGFMGSMHTAVYSHLPDVNIVGIADIRGEKVKALTKKFKTIPYFDAQQLLDKEDISMIDVCLPTYMHKEFVIKAAERGKDVICEKPIALTVEDANEMIEACEKNRVRLMIGHVVRFFPEYQILKEAYDRKKYGELLTLSCRRLSPLPTWGWEDWLLDSNKSGGAILDLHIHDTDFLSYLLGKPKKIYSKTNSKGLPYAHVHTTFTFDNDLIVTAEGAWDYPANFPFEATYIAKFEKATITFNSGNNPSVVIYEAAGKIEKPTFGKMQTENAGGNVDDLGGYFYELRYFVDHIIHNKPGNIVLPENARDSLAIVLKEKESADTGKEITL